MKWREKALRKKANHIMGLIRQHAKITRCEEGVERDRLVLAFGEGFKTYLRRYPTEDTTTFSRFCALMLLAPHERGGEVEYRMTWRIWVLVMEVLLQAKELEMKEVAS